MADAPEKKKRAPAKKKASSAKKATAKKGTGTTTKKAAAKKASSSTRALPTHDEIARRAYEIHEREGGHHEDNWHRAERELKGSS
jgi:BRCT domain type II-containing protein